MIKHLYYKFPDVFLSFGFLLLPLDRKLIKSLRIHAINVDSTPTAYALEQIRTCLERDDTQEEIKQIWRILTYRQRQIALLITQNLTYPEIGKKLYISSSTVRDHARTIRDHFGVPNKHRLRRKLMLLPDQYFDVVKDIDSLA